MSAKLPKDDLEEDELEEGLPPLDAAEAVEAAGLYYVMEGEPGFTRKTARGKFVYLDLQGQPITSPRRLKRLQALVIPPAWTEVWICCRPNGHIQATGRDKKGRKQYRYHAGWNAARSQAKFSRMVAFGEALPAIRARVEQDLRGAQLSHEKVTALVLRLLERTLIRVGNQEYARQNNSYGLTTLLDNHVQVEGSRVRLEFVGKKGKFFEVDLRDRRLTGLLKRCQDLPGQRLFQYVPENGECCRSITSGDVNAYLRGAAGSEFSAKDFRTWGGTGMAAVELYQRGPAGDEKAAEKEIVQVVKQVAETLGNTPAVCRRYYIHPAVLEGYQAGSLFEAMTAGLRQAREPEPNGLNIEEQAVLHLLRMSTQAG